MIFLVQKKKKMIMIGKLSIVFLQINQLSTFRKIIFFFLPFVDNNCLIICRLKTPPATPLFPSLEMEANDPNMIFQRELPIPQSIKPSRVHTIYIRFFSKSSGYMLPCLRF